MLKVVLLLSISIDDLQSLIDMYVVELDQIDMQLNINNHVVSLSVIEDLWKLLI